MAHEVEFLVLRQTLSTFPWLCFRRLRNSEGLRRTLRVLSFLQMFGAKQLRRLVVECPADFFMLTHRMWLDQRITLEAIAMFAFYAVFGLVCVVGDMGAAAVQDALERSCHHAAHNT